MAKRTFASDNYSGVHPEIMMALNDANQGHAVSYGSDEYTVRATKKFKDFFGEDIGVYFVYNGTGANVSALCAITYSFNSIICSRLAHINVDESTAPERFTGCKLIGIRTDDGKIYPDEIEAHIQRLDDQHHPQAKVISISQCTEYGTVYSAEEIRAIAEVARKYDLFLHMDGSRIANAAVSLNKDFKSFTRDAGVDVLSFGGTKNGMMFGEAVVFFNDSLAPHFKFIRKQSMQLHSKMRFIAAQFECLLSHDLWEKNARNANDMAKHLERALRKISAVKVTQSVDANSIFAILPPEITSALQQDFFFYVWDEKTNEVRLMCSFDTTEEDVQKFAKRLNELTA
jgi:threonine aldolase